MEGGTRLDQGHVDGFSDPLFIQKGKERQQIKLSVAGGIVQEEIVDQPLQLRPIVPAQEEAQVGAGKAVDEGQDASSHIHLNCGSQPLRSQAVSLEEAPDV